MFILNRETIIKLGGKKTMWSWVYRFRFIPFSGIFILQVVVIGILPQLRIQWKLLHKYFHLSFCITDRFFIINIHQDFI